MADDRILQLILDRANSIELKLDAFARSMNGRVDDIDVRLSKMEAVRNHKEKARNRGLTVKLVCLTAGLGAFWWVIAEVIKRYMLA